MVSISIPPTNPSILPHSQSLTPSKIVLLVSLVFQAAVAMQHSLAAEHSPLNGTIRRYSVLSHSNPLLLERLWQRAFPHTGKDRGSLFHKAGGTSASTHILQPVSCALPFNVASCRSLATFHLTHYIAITVTSYTQRKKRRIYTRGCYKTAAPAIP